MNLHSSETHKRPSKAKREANPESSRKQRERADHRQVMLGAAEQIFVRKGFRDATIAEIAREADFAVGTFYNFFKSKDDLYAQVLDGIVREFVAEFERDVRQRDDPADALSALVDLRMRVFDRHRDFFRLFFEQSAAGVKLTGRHLKLREQYRAAVAAIFARGVKRGLFDKLDPLYAAICLDGMLNAFVRHWSAHEGGKPSPERLKIMKETVLSRFRVRRN